MSDKSSWAVSFRMHMQKGKTDSTLYEILRKFFEILSSVNCQKKPTKMRCQCIYVLEPFKFRDSVHQNIGCGMKTGWTMPKLSLYVVLYIPKMSRVCWRVITLFYPYSSFYLKVTFMHEIIFETYFFKNNETFFKVYIM